MLTRLIGSDAEIEFSQDLLDLFRRAEDAFPEPDWVIIFNDGTEEDEPDELVFCRRFSGVPMPIAYVDVDEIAALEEEGTDWLADLKQQLERTEAEIESEIEAAEASMCETDLTDEGDDGTGSASGDSEEAAKPAGSD